MRICGEKTSLGGNRVLRSERAVIGYLVDGTRRPLPAGAAARLHHVADVSSGGQQGGHVHGGPRPQGASPGLVGPRYAVHLDLPQGHRRSQSAPGIGGAVSSEEEEEREEEETKEEEEREEEEEEREEEREEEEEEWEEEEREEEETSGRRRRSRRRRRSSSSSSRWWSCLGPVCPAEGHHRDVQTFDHHLAPTLVLCSQSRVDDVQLLLRLENKSVALKCI